MSRLAFATDDQIDAITRETHGLWGAGLTLRDYRALWDEIRTCAWARQHARFVVWVDEQEQVLSSMKVYTPRLRWAGDETRCNVFGAIFTPRARRGQGHATRMLRAMLEKQGKAPTLLFSDVGTRWYSRLDFLPLAAEEQWAQVPGGLGPCPDVELRPAVFEDLPAFRAAHDAWCERRPFALLRDAEHWEYLWLRACGFFDRLDDERVRQCWQVAQLRGEFAGYLITVEGYGEWNVREIGAAHGESAVMLRILAAGASQARRVGIGPLYGWLPPELVGRMVGWRLRSRTRRRALPMLRPGDAKDDAATRTSAGASYLPFQDQF